MSNKIIEYKKEKALLSNLLHEIGRAEYHLDCACGIWYDSYSASRQNDNDDLLGKIAQKVSDEYQKKTKQYEDICHKLQMVEDEQFQKEMDESESESEC